MRWPDVLDFEASGFGHQSYPIEVGYSLADGQRFCTLIRPVADWNYWDPCAQALHGITRELLMDVGMDVASTCRELNQRLAGRTLYSDAWVVDKVWFDRLFYAGKTTPRFHLSPIEIIQSECQHLLWDEVRQSLMREKGLQRHRASADAQLIQRIFEQTRARCAERKAAEEE